MTPTDREIIKSSLSMQISEEYSCEGGKTIYINLCWDDEVISYDSIYIKD